MNKATYGQHSKELITRLIISVIAWFILFVLSYININPLMEHLKFTAEAQGFTLIYIRVQDILLQELKLAAIIALILAFPIILFEATGFIFPVFESKRTKVVFILIELVTILLFIIGVFFSYKVILPFVLSYLGGVGAEIDIMGAVDIKEYISFYITILFCMGFIFEIPLILVSVNRLGVISVDKLKGLRRYVIVLSFIIAAIITPPDVVSQFMVALPMVLLYEVSLILCRISGFKRKKEYKTGYINP